jgi:hypothetical protein
MMTAITAAAASAASQIFILRPTLHTRALLHIHRHFTATPSFGLSARRRIIQTKVDPHSDDDGPDEENEKSDDEVPGLSALCAEY